MKPSELDIKKYVTDPDTYDRKDSFQRVSIVWYSIDDEYCIQHEYYASVPCEVVHFLYFSYKKELSFLRVKASAFKKAVGRIKKGDDELWKVELFYEDGTEDGGRWNDIPLRIAAYVKERDALYFEAEEDKKED